MPGRPKALITGGARRVGAEIARTLADTGCDVAVTYRTSEREAEATLSDIAGSGARAIAIRADLADTASLPALAEEALRSLGGLDILVHNASIYEPSPLEDLDPARALRQYAINALAPLVLTARLADALRASTLPSGGAVVCMSDIHVLGRPRRGFAAYSMSKAALTQLVECLARDLAPRVRVNAVAPGVVAWPEQGLESDETTQQAYLKRVPLDRAGTPTDAAQAVRWLALEAAYCTGQIIRVDGGRWLA